MTGDKQHQHFKEEGVHFDEHRRIGERMEGRRGGRGSGGAKTFRRARALLFLQKLEVQRDALKKQLETPELQSINPIIVGELKAVEMMMAEFIATFELQEEIDLSEHEN